MSETKKGHEKYDVTITSKNIDREATNFENIQKLRIVDIRITIEPDFLSPCQETLQVLEFKGVITLRNIISLLNFCGSVTELIVNNVRLDSFQRFYGNFTELKISKLIFYGQDKLTRNEAHIISYFNRRIQFSQLYSIIFEQKIRSKINSSASRLVKPQPVNDVSNSVTTTVLSNFLVKCSVTLKELVVNRKILLFHDEMSGQEVKQIQLEKLICDMNSTGFEQLMNLQQNLQFLQCHNSLSLRPYTFEAIIVCIQRNLKSLREVRLANKFIFKTDNQNLGKVPNVIMHDCSIYDSCAQLQHLRLLLSSRSYTNEFDIKPGGIINTWGCPSTLKSLIISIDIITDLEMNSSGLKMCEFHNLKYLIINGNPKSPFIMRLCWIQDLFDLPQKIQLFEFHSCRFKEEAPDFDSLRKNVDKSISKFIINLNCCIFWRNKKTSWNWDDDIYE